MSEKISSIEDYNKLYSQSLADPEGFWGKVAERIFWFKKWKNIRSFDFVNAKNTWFEEGKLNVCYNCLDRHIEAGNGDKIAFLWEGNDFESKKITYSELLKDVKKFSNVLKKHGVKKGDRVCIYMQMIPEAIVSMLACARIGAVHSVVFGAFSAESLRDRMNDSHCSMLITQDSANRGDKKGILMKNIADEAALGTKTLRNMIIVNRNNTKVNMQSGRDFFWKEEMEFIDDECPVEIMDSEDPLFVLYTSGSTGKPKGVLHTTAGYLLYVSYTHDLVFNCKKEDIFWCTADIGWITGHSYIVYGPLANLTTSVIYEGIPTYPDPGRVWNIIEKYNVTVFYTSPTALRSLMKEGDNWPNKYNLNSLKVLGSVGEPIKEPEWIWYHKVIGKERCPIVDTWWQTETGGIMISPISRLPLLKPGSVALPLPGIEPVILDEKGNELPGKSQGFLAIKSSWPGIMRTIYGDHEKFREMYFSKFPGYYLTGDGAKRDEEGYYWIIGRVDDVINVSGHRIGTAEVEGAIGKTLGVAEAAVVAYPHEIKGQGIYAFVTLMNSHAPNTEMEKKIKEEVKKHIGPHAIPEKIQFTPVLPKTRSGKIMRRILRKIAEGNLENFGDTSTLIDSSIIEKLVKERQ